MPEEVTIIKPDGTKMDEQEAIEFLKALQAGTQYIPQGKEENSYGE